MSTVHSSPWLVAAQLLLKAKRGRLAKVRHGGPVEGRWRASNIRNRKRRSSGTGRSELMTVRVTGQRGAATTAAAGEAAT